MFRLRILVVLGVSIAVAGCSDDDDGNGTMDPGPTPVAYATEIQPIFDAECVRCHGEGGNGGLDLRPGVSRDNMVGIESQGYAPALRVVAGSPSTSVLHEKVADTGAFGTAMPPSTGLSSGEVELIRRWIEEGANP